MYTFLVNSDDSLIATVREPIYHRSSMMRKMQFLVDPDWVSDGETSDLRTYICTLEYRTPVTKKYVPVILNPSEELYKNKLQYVLDIDTAITAEVGNVELKLTWVKLEMNKDGTFKERCRVTPHTTFEVLSVAQWSDYVPDSNLDKITQTLLKSQAIVEQTKIYVEQIEELGKTFTLSKADNVKYDKKDNSLQLESMGNPIGDKVILSECNDTGSDGSSNEDGLPTVDFNPVVETSDANDDGKFETVLF